MFSSQIEDLSQQAQVQVRFELFSVVCQMNICTAIALIYDFPVCFFCGKIALNFYFVSLFIC